uniref:Uncharacterized protein n=1 Tax=Nyctotherus ovalis TaxID=70075 RepID=Q5DUX6_NYCOV|nr:hypothetical protein [Nyctotherus ovalis]
MREQLYFRVSRFTNEWYHPAVHNYAPLEVLDPVMRSIYLTNAFSRLTLKQRLDSHPMLPYEKDSILRIYSIYYHWRLFSRKHIILRGRQLTRMELGHIARTFRTLPGMIGIKFGSWSRTRRIGRFRANVDKKKLKKLKRDIAKTKKMKLHWEKENARLLRKAAAGTRSRGRSKLKVAAGKTKSKGASTKKEKPKKGGKK